MFGDKMVTPAIPERVYALCKLIEKGPATNTDLKDRMEPDYLENGTSYYADYRNAAEELGLITISDDSISLAVDSKTVKTMDSMRGYINGKLDNFNDGQFYTITKALFEMDSNILKGEKNIANMGPELTQLTGRSVDAMALRAWRFWVSYLGFGYLQDMFFIPNAKVFIWDVICSSEMEKGKLYSVSDFVDAIRPACNIVVDSITARQRFNYGVSNGLRALHDSGLIKLQHIGDQKDMWEIYPMVAHPFNDSVTNITICK
jgi:hypothetical protein